MYFYEFIYLCEDCGHVFYTPRDREVKECPKCGGDDFYLTENENTSSGGHTRSTSGSETVS